MSSGEGSFILGKGDYIHLPWIHQAVLAKFVGSDLFMLSVFFDNTVGKRISRLPTQLTLLAQLGKGKRLADSTPQVGDLSAPPQVPPIRNL